MIPHQNDTSGVCGERKSSSLKWYLTKTIQGFRKNSSTKMIQENNWKYDVFTSFLPKSPLTSSLLFSLEWLGWGCNGLRVMFCWMGCGSAVRWMQHMQWHLPRFVIAILNIVSLRKSPPTHKKDSIIFWFECIKTDIVPNVSIQSKFYPHTFQYFFSF